MINFRKIFLTGILVFALILVFSTQATLAVDVNINDASPGGINGALAIANDSDTIILASGTYDKINEDYNIMVNKNVTIRGDGPTGSVIINGQNQTKIFTISPNLNVTFINLTFTNGNQDYVDNGTTNQGGAIYAVDTMVNIVNCAFTNNTASNYGGAICAIRTSLSIIDANFLNNSVTLHSNGTNYYGGGAIYSVNGTFTVSTSNFTDNTVANRGGAIYSDNSLVDVNDSNFINNSAINLGENTAYGGAIYNTGANFSIVNSNFTENYVHSNGSSNLYSYGGAIYNTGVNYSVVNSNFTENYAISIVNSSRNFNIYSNSSGGAIYNVGDGFSLVNSIFTENNARSTSNRANTDYAYYSFSNGGAIYNTGVGFSVANSTFTENYASSTSNSSSSNSNGGAIYNTGVGFSVANSTFTENYASSISNSGRFSSGGAIYNAGTNFSIVNSNFTENYAHNVSYNQLSYGGAIYNTGADFSATNSNFTNNNASIGGAIFNTGNFSSVTNSTFSDNRAYNGSVIYNSGGIDFIVVDSVFIHNAASYGGGAIYNERGNNFKVVTSNFTNNSARTTTGVIYNFGGANFSVVNSTFTGNYVTMPGGTRGGGAIYTTGVNFSVVDSNFTNNNATRGGAIDNRGNFSSVANSTFTDNWVTIYNGGAIYNEGFSFSVVDSTFTGNNATQNGGAIYNNGSDNFRVFNSSFTNNRGSNGASICINISENCSVTNSTFTGNNASSYGGGIYSTGINFSIINSIFDENNATFGGGVYIAGNDSIITNSNFTNNSQGIGIGTTIFTLNNNRIMDNGIAIQFVLVNETYTIYALSTNNYISDNVFAIGISGNGSNYTVDDSFGLLNNGGFIFTTNARNNTIVDSDIRGYYRSDSWAIFFNSVNNNNNSVISSNITNNLNCIFFNGYAPNNNYNSLVSCNITNNINGVVFNGSSRNNSLVSCNISNNTYGIVINGTNNRVLGCDIFNNHLGIQVLSGSSGAVINYNRILNNTDSNGFDLLNGGSNTNANLNWWGNNTELVSGITLANRFVMALSANSYRTIVNNRTNQTIGNIELTYELVLIDSAGIISSIVDYNLLPDFLVNLIWNDSSGTIYTSVNANGKEKHSYTVSLNYENSYSLEVIGDNADIILYLDPDLSNVVNISISKTTNVSGDANYGEEITYIITVTNHGPVDATGLMITDMLDSRLIYQSAAGDKTWNFDSVTNTLTWDIGNLLVNGAVTLNIIVKINGTGPIDNFANLTNVNQDNMGNNSTDGVDGAIDVVETVNLTITKVMNTSSANMGDLLTYTVTVTYHGPDMATGLVVIDELDYRLIYQSASGDRVFEYNATTHTVIWYIGDLALNGIVNLDIFVLINGTGPINNLANVTNVTENNIGNNSTVDNNNTIEIPPAVNLTIIKTTNVTNSLNLGDLVTYTINVTNHGPDNATGVVVTDILDSRLVFVSTTGAYDEITGIWTIGNLDVDQTVSINITVRVNGTGNIENIANVNSNQHNIGNNTTDGANNSTINVPYLVNLTITKTSNASNSVNFGDLITYTITVSNHGPGNATGVIVTDILDTRLIFVSTTGAYDEITGIWTIGNLDDNQIVYINITVRVNGTGNISNIANVNSNENNIGNNTTDGANNSTINVPGLVNLVITKTSNVTGNMTVGDLVTYTITVTNLGPENATGVFVTDILDTRLIFVSTTGAYDEITGIWTIGNLDVNQTVFINITVSINGVGNIVNIANVSSNENNIGNNATDGGNNSTINVSGLVTLIVTKTSNVTGNATVGDLIAYTITLTNYGPSNATGVRVSDVLDSRLIYLSSNATKGGYNPATGFWNIGNLSVGQTVTLTIVVKVNASGTIVNTVSVFADEKVLGVSVDPVIINVSDSINTPDNPDDNPDDPVSPDNPDDIDEDDPDVNRVLGESRNSEVNMLNTGVPMIAIFTIVLLFSLLGSVFKRK